MILAPQPTISCNTGGSFILTDVDQDDCKLLVSVDHIIQSIPFPFLDFEDDIKIINLHVLKFGLL
jgi:hypothetical protein